MRIPLLLLACAFFLAFLSSCRKAYTPVVTSKNYGYLVVEGVINSGNDTTTIMLSHTRQLDSNKVIYETKARVIVESDQNASYPLAEIAPGTYVAVNLNLSVTAKYRLHIYTATNKEYVSDYVENKITPPIDSIPYQILGSGVQFYVNTHDPANNTRYYRWEYGEAYTYYSQIYASLAYQNNEVVPQQDPNDYCYRFDIPDNNVFISTSDDLKQDVINQFPLVFTAGQSKYWKFQSEYALTVKQYALTADAYKFWKLLKTNTEQLGSIFDAQPSSGFTNIHSVTNPGEPVVGFVSVSTVTIKRVFLTDRDFTFPVRPPIRSDTLSCGRDSVLFTPIQTFPDRLRTALGSGDSLVYDTYRDKSGVVLGYWYAPAKCVDCRLDDGTTTKPSYWPF